MESLTERQQSILQWIRQCLSRDGVPPTMREIGERFGISAPGVLGHLRALERKGYVRWRRGRARALEVLAAAAGAGGESANGGRSRSAERVPVLGRIVAGRPLLAVENEEGEIAVDEDLLRPRGAEFFALRVRGESMTGAGILEGDTVIVRRQETARDGEIVVALIDGEATLKRFFAEKGGFRLEAANPAMGPIRVGGGASEALVQGVVTGLVRRYGG